MGLQIDKLTKLKLYTNSEPVLANLVYLRKLKIALESGSSSPVARVRLENKEPKENKSKIKDTATGVKTNSKPKREEADIAKEIDALKVQIGQLAQLKEGAQIKAMREAHDRLALLEMAEDPRTFKVLQGASCIKKES